MLYNFLKTHLGQNAAPFVAILMFVAIVGVSLWLTPKLAKWIDNRRSNSPGMFDDLMEKPPEKNEGEEE